MPVRSAPLARATLLTTASTVLATVPTGETWLVKAVDVYYPGATAATLLLWVRNIAADVTQVIVNRSFPSGDVFHLELWLALTPGDQISAQAGAAGHRVWVSGTRLIGVA